jgi:proteasome lid subunit RPN8/RPN11
MIKFARGELEKIRELLRLSWRENREVGAKLCGSKEEVILGTTCIGDYCSLELKDCRGRPVIGSIHTHPHSAPYLSEEDVIHAVLDGESVMCVCGNAKAPGIAVEFEKPVPFRNIVCRCWEVDKDKEAYESIRRIFKEAEPEIRREMEELEASLNIRLMLS